MSSNVTPVTSSSSDENTSNIDKKSKYQKISHSQSVSTLIKELQINSQAMEQPSDVSNRVPRRDEEAGRQPPVLPKGNLHNMISFTEMSLLDPSVNINAKRTLYDTYSLHKLVNNDDTDPANAATIAHITSKFQVGCAGVLGGNNYGQYVEAVHIANALGVPAPAAPVMALNSSHFKSNKGNNNRRGRGRGRANKK
jgi:hypothetical protein